MTAAPGNSSTAVKRKAGGVVESSNKHLTPPLLCHSALEQFFWWCGVRWLSFQTSNSPHIPCVIRLLNNFLVGWGEVVVLPTKHVRFGGVGGRGQKLQVLLNNPRQESISHLVFGRSVSQLVLQFSAVFLHPSREIFVSLFHRSSPLPDSVAMVAGLGNQRFGLM